jgi:transposase
MAYSLDMRKRAMSLVAQGHSCIVIGEMLGVSGRTVSGWRNRYQVDRLAAEYPKERGAYKINDKALIAHLEAYPDAYAEELAKVAGGTSQGIRDACKRLGITRKKRLRNTASVTKKNEKSTSKP